MKRLLKSFGVLFLLLFQLASCVDLDNERNRILYYYDEPVVVDQMGDYPVVHNESYVLYVPGLKENTALKAGDLLWTSFIVDLDDHNTEAQLSLSNDVYYTAMNFRYKTVDSAKVIIPSDAAAFNGYLSDDYSTPIELSALFPYNIDNLWFFGFKHNDNSNKTNYTYELILNPEIENGQNYPTLYIRAKQIDASAADSEKAYSIRDGNIFAFDVKDFANYYKETFPTKNVEFNLKYKTGVDAAGKDVYRSFLSNPIPWTFKTLNPE